MSAMDYETLTEAEWERVQGVWQLLDEGRLEDARAELGLDREAFVVGIVAGLREEKAHEVLFRAAARLRDEGRDLRVCVVGDGKQRAWLADTRATVT